MNSPASQDEREKSVISVSSRHGKREKGGSVLYPDIEKRTASKGLPRRHRRGGKKKKKGAISPYREEEREGRYPILAVKEKGTSDTSGREKGGKGSLIFK